MGLAQRYSYLNLDKFSRPKRVLSALLHFNVDPRNFRRVIHVTGSSGKGTTSYLIFSLLRYLKFNVAAYIKPHLVSPAERLIINEGFVSPSEFLGYLERVKALVTNEKFIKRYGLYKYVEMMFTASMLYLLENHTDIDFLIVEAGIGLKDDYTNIFVNRVKDYYILITDIQRVHRKRLGRTKNQIFANKNANHRYAKKTFLLFDAFSHIDVPLSEKIIHIRPQRRYQTTICGSVLKTDNITFLTNLHFKKHVDLFARVKETLSHIGVVKSRLEEIAKDYKYFLFYVNLPARFQPVRIGNNLWIIDLAHHRVQYRKLYQTLKQLATEYGINIDVVSLTLDKHKASASREVFKDHIVFEDVKGVDETINPVSVKLPKLSENTLGLLTGSVYFVADALIRGEAPLHPTNKNSVIKRVASDRGLIRFLFKTRRKKKFIRKVASEDFQKRFVKFIETYKITPSKVGFFKSFKTEIDLGFIPSLFEGMNDIEFFVPIKKKEAEIGYLIKSLKDQKEYPTFKESGFKASDIILVPALGSDGFARRLGYGKGVYDYFTKGLTYVVVDLYKKRFSFFLVTPSGKKDYYVPFSLDTQTKRFLGVDRVARRVDKEALKKYPIVVYVTYRQENVPFVL